MLFSPLACAAVVAALAQVGDVEGTAGLWAPHTPAQLVRKSRCELLGLYTAAEPGAAPCGFVPGRAFQPGRPLGPARSALLSRTLWQGKIFLDDSHMVNKVLGSER